MTDPHSSDADELLSAYLDGAVTPEEATRIESDPALLARASELRRAIQAVGTVMPPSPDAAREAAIARALAEGAVVLSGTEVPSDDELIPARLRSWRHHRTRVLSIAAAVVLLLIAVPLVARLLTDDGDGTLAGSGPSTPPAARSTTDEGTEAFAFGTSGAGAYDLGQVDTSDELARRVLPLLDQGADDDQDAVQDASPRVAQESRAAATASAPAECEERVRRTEPSLGPAVWIGEATYRGDHVQVFVFAPEESARTMVVAATGDRCSIRARRQL